MDAIRQALPKTAKAIANDFAAGQHKGFQLFVSLKGETIANGAHGEAAPDVPMTTDTLVSWLSSGKPLTSIAIGLLWQRRELKLDDSIARFIPEFAANGKEGITVRHLLTHTGGFPNADPEYPNVTWQESIKKIASSPLVENWQVGRTGGYHTSSSWFILGEVIARATGVPFAEFIRKEITAPFGMADVSFLTDQEELSTQSNRLGSMWRRQGRDVQPLDWHQPPRIHRASPGSSARGPIRELGRFYEQLLAILAGGQGVVSPQTAEAMTTPHRVGELDRTFQHVVDFGLGFLVNSNRYGAETVPYGFGKHASPRAFGHGGSQSSIGFGDPEHGLIVAWAANAMVGEPRHQKRNRAINTAIYEDLGLA